MFKSLRNPKYEYFINSLTNLQFAVYYLKNNGVFIKFETMQSKYEKVGVCEG